MSLADWDQLEERRRLEEWAAQQVACREHAERKARRRAGRRVFVRWCNPFLQVAGHPGEPRP